MVRTDVMEKMNVLHLPGNKSRLCDYWPGILQTALYPWFEVLTVVSMKVGGRDLSISRAQLDHRPDDGGSTDLWNVGKLIPVYRALQPRRRPSSVMVILWLSYFYALEKVSLNKLRNSEEEKQMSTKFILIIISRRITNISRIHILLITS
jgi:hypothetical protein